MRGVKSEDLLAVVDFLYFGEANVYQENLETFLVIAKELKLKGLNGGGNTDAKEGEVYQYHKDTLTARSALSLPNDIHEQVKIVKENLSVVSEPYLNGQHGSEMSVAMSKQDISGDIHELDKTIETMMRRGENMSKSGNSMSKAYVCQVGGKEGQRGQVKDHIEANHLEGISLPCNVCDKTFRSRSAMKMHTSRHHTNYA